MLFFQTLRDEIILRLNRETQYVIALSEILSDKDISANRLEAKKFLEKKLIDNDKGLRLINEFISSYAEKNVIEIEWEQFIKEKYWDNEVA